MLALTLMVIIQFCMAVSISYLHDRIKKIEQVQNNQANDLARMGVETSHTEVMVRQIYEKMFRPRQTKEEKSKPKVDPELAAILPTAEDFYQGIRTNFLPSSKIPQFQTFSIKKEEWHEVAKICPKEKMTARELTDYVMQACNTRLVAVRGNKLFRKGDFKGTSKFYFVDVEKKVDGRGRGPRDENGKFIKKYVKPGEPIKSGQTMKVEVTYS